ncbi:tRNA-uridine aminocarboxypropyltransferase 1-like [Corticium candelabrum]|uniref:tRNA-uridine aminocarboxypropyltransferase 1-like n=1 Tax=Corticium candelabrum TaxID=121492 RepID=UPI002E26C839|nr:tRNA-uridine aminocarboxypropyltransferase 1-like [Corticium candelabrum]
MAFELAATPFRRLKLASFAPLISAERAVCPKCKSSRKYFCYTCFIPVGISESSLPTVELPLQVDIIKHSLERVGKSTSSHARILSPHSVNIHIYPDIPSYSDTNKVLLLFPGPETPSLDSLLPGKTTEHKQCSTGVSSAKRQRLQRPLCERLIVVDSTWSQAKRITADDRLHDIPRVQLKQAETFFWRKQSKPSHYLATIEAIYYFFKQLHELQEERSYDGQYDNLLYFFAFQYLLIKNKKETK